MGESVRLRVRGHVAGGEREREKGTPLWEAKK